MAYSSRSVLLFLLLAGLLAACGASDTTTGDTEPADSNTSPTPDAEAAVSLTPSDDSVVALPTCEDDFCGEDAELGGELATDGQCVWVEGESTSNNTDVRWPQASTARIGPDGLELMDPNGAVLAREGDRLRLTGGVYDGDGSTCAPGGDPSTEFWVRGIEVVSNSAAEGSSSEPAQQLMPLEIYDYEGEDAEVSGVLEVDTESGCTYLQSGTVPRRAVLWPPGFQLDPSSGEVIDDSGEVLAVGGDMIVSTGGAYENLGESSCGTERIVRVREDVGVEE